MPLQLGPARFRADNRASRGRLLRKQSVSLRSHALRLLLPVRRMVVGYARRTTTIHTVRLCWHPQKMVAFQGTNSQHRKTNRSWQHPSIGRPHDTRSRTHWSNILKTHPRWTNTHKAAVRCQGAPTTTHSTQSNCKAESGNTVATNAANAEQHMRGRTFTRNMNPNIRDRQPDNHPPARH